MFAVGGSCALIFLAVYSRQQTLRLHQEAQDTTQEEAVEIAEDISSQLEQIRPLVEELTARLTESALAEGDLAGTLEHTFAAGQAQDLGLLEVGVAFVPDVAGTRNAPHFGFQNGRDTPTHFQVEDDYDYTTYPWYQNGLRDGSHWTEPYFGKATESWAAGYGARSSETVRAARPLASPGSISN